MAEYEQLDNPWFDSLTTSLGRGESKTMGTLAPRMFLFIELILRFLVGNLSGIELIGDMLLLLADD